MESLPTVLKSIINEFGDEKQRYTWMCLYGRVVDELACLQDIESYKKWLKKKWINRNWYCSSRLAFPFKVNMDN